MSGTEIEGEFAAQLARWRERHVNDPVGELREILLLGLEREELVSVGYRETFLARRVAGLPVPPDVRDLVRHALLWTWRDEEMHAVWVRGALLRSGGVTGKARAYAQQISGALGGWAASVLQHVPSRDAPVSRAVARVLTWAGSVAGKVPADVRPYLDERPFRDFCELNVHAEHTAEACWRRAIEVAREASSDDDLVAALVRMAEDERRHGLAFAAIERALDAGNALVGPDAGARLRSDLEAIGDAFLPRSLRRGEIGRCPLGSGGAVAVAKRRADEDVAVLARRAALDAGVDEMLAARARECGKPLGELRVVIRPSFMFSCHPRDRSSFTDPDLVAGLVATLRELGARDIALLECRNIYERFFARRSVAEVATRLGYDRLGLPVHDAALEQEPHDYARGMDQSSIARTWRDADVRIGFGKLKSHPTEMVFGALQGLQSMGGRVEDYLFPERLADHAAVTLAALDAFPPHFVLLDAVEAADGVAGILGCPRPALPGRVYAARDALALDLVAARHAGLDDPLASPCLRAACHWFGDPRSSTVVRGCDEPIPGWRSPRNGEWRTFLSLLAWPAYSHGSDRGAIFVPVVDEASFPPLGSDGTCRRGARHVVHALLGLAQPE